MAGASGRTARVRRIGRRVEALARDEADPERPERVADKLRRKLKVGRPGGAHSVETTPDGTGGLRVVVRPGQLRPGKAHVLTRKVMQYSGYSLEGG